MKMRLFWKTTPCPSLERCAWASTRAYGRSIWSSTGPLPAPRPGCWASHAAQSLVGVFCLPDLAPQIRFTGTRLRSEFMDTCTIGQSLPAVNPRERLPRLS